MTTRPIDKPTNIINHIGFLFDESSSMHCLRKAVIKVVDDQVAHLAATSQTMDQETRVTLWSFAGAGTARCLVWDRDVLRLPSIDGLYHPNGNTALIDATLFALDDFATIPTHYGDQSFLLYGVTDGEENNSHNRPQALVGRLMGLPDNWTVALLVPDATGKHNAKRYGFPADNIAVWDPFSERGVEESGLEIQRATDNYMAGRARGERGSRSVFSTGAAAVNKATVAATGMTPLDPRTFLLIPVPRVCEIREFVQAAGHRYVTGNAYYQLSKREHIQPQKLIAVVEKATSKVYVGREARDLVGLPDVEVLVGPEHNPLFDVFVQSTSVNRKLMLGTRLLLLT